MSGYRKDDDGRLNNFAVEPKMYMAEPATSAQKRNTAIAAIAGLALAAGLAVVASFVS